jgi:hypothetical protein
MAAEHPLTWDTVDSALVDGERTHCVRQTHAPRIGGSSSLAASLSNDGAAQAWTPESRRFTRGLADSRRPRTRNRHLERVVGDPSVRVAEGRRKFKMGLLKSAGVAARRGQSPGLLPTLLPTPASFRLLTLALRRPYGTQRNTAHG